MRKSIILPLLIVAIGQGVFGQSKPKRYADYIAYGKIYIKYYTAIDSNHDLKYYKADTLHFEEKATELEYYDGKYWYSKASDFPILSGDRKYFLNGKEIYPIDIKKQENIFTGYQLRAVINKSNQ